jgi:uncharacterized membrane protein HdeD (DUF308 family)
MHQLIVNYTMLLRIKEGERVCISAVDRPRTSAALTRSMHDHWRMYLIEGVILSALGLAAMIVPTVAGLAATFLLGWLFIVAGFVALVVTFVGRIFRDLGGRTFRRSLLCWPALYCCGTRFIVWPC